MSHAYNGRELPLATLSGDRLPVGPKYRVRALCLAICDPGPMSSGAPSRQPCDKYRRTKRCSVLLPPSRPELSCVVIVQRMKVDVNIQFPQKFVADTGRTPKGGGNTRP